MKKHIFPIILVFIGLIFNFAFSGHGFIAYSCYFLAALIEILRIAGRRLKRLIIFLLIICLAYFIAVEIPIIGAASGDADFDADYIIVLGALVRGEEPSLAMVERTQAALDYLNAHPDTVAIVSGGQGELEDISEAEAMRRWLSEHGVSSSRIILEDKSTSTEENLKNSFEIIESRGDDPSDAAAIVTSEYHIYRAKLIGEKLGVELGAISAHTTYPSIMLNYFIREAFGVTYQWVFG